MAPNNESDEKGFIFAATGKDYVKLACNAAQSLSKASPNFPIDLFTNLPSEVPEGIFSKIIPLGDDFVRPKMRALRNSRFNKTIYLDADVIVVSDISDIFEVLNQFDIAAAMDEFQNHRLAHRIHSCAMPAAFPQLNGGVLGIKNSPGSQKFLNDWDAAVRNSPIKRDQPALRELLFFSDLRLATLPHEYNHMDIFRGFTHRHSEHIAPRVFHLPQLHLRFDSRKTPDTSLKSILGRKRYRWLKKITAADKTLNPDGPDIDFPALHQMGIKGFLRKVARKMLWFLR